MPLGEWRVFGGPGVLENVKLLFFYFFPPHPYKRRGAQPKYKGGIQEKPQIREKKKNKIYFWFHLDKYVPQTF
jgi:hypothetical protein